MPTPKAVYNAPRYQLIVAYAYAIPFFLICAFACIALLATGNSSAAVPFVLFTAFGGVMLYHLGWRVSRRLVLTDTTLRWQGVFRRGEVPIGRIRDANQ